MKSGPSPWSCNRGERVEPQRLSSGEKSSEAMLSSTLRNSSCFRFRRLRLLWWIFRRGYNHGNVLSWIQVHPCAGEGDVKVCKVDMAVIPCSRMDKSRCSTKRLFWGTWAQRLPAASPTAEALGADQLQPYADLHSRLMLFVFTVRMAAPAMKKSNPLARGYQITV